MKQFTIIVKVTNNCNLSCSYCYEGDNFSSHFIEWETVQNTILKTLDYVDPETTIKFIWHGGEPLLIGLDFYEKIIDLQEKVGKGQKIINSIQTNGILLSERIIKFLIENNFRIGISIDGPPIIHDSQRLFSNNQGSFDQVFKSVLILRKYYANSDNRISAISVFTKNTYNHLDEFYNFFKNQKINVKINPLLMSGRANLNYFRQNLFITPYEFGSGLINLFEKWIAEDEYVFNIEPFKNVIMSMVTGNTFSCIFSGHCYDRYLSINPHGDIVPCGRWNSDQFLYGNINFDSIETSLNSFDCYRFKQQRIIAENKCKKCKYFGICHGGCPFSGYLRRSNLSDPDYYCEGYKMLFSHIEHKLKDLLLMDGQSNSIVSQKGIEDYE